MSGFGYYNEEFLSNTRYFEKSRVLRGTFSRKIPTGKTPAENRRKAKRGRNRRASQESKTHKKVCPKTEADRYFLLSCL